MIKFAQQRATADALARAHWSVVDGELRFDGRGDNLMSYEEFGDIELLIDWKIPANADTGVYLRGTPQIQIWDNPDEGSGGLYNNRENPSEALTPADHPIGDWNHFHIISIGDRVTVHLNGKIVTLDTVLENYWDRDQPLLAEGPIELQRHNAPISFRNIYVRSLDAQPLRLDGEAHVLPLTGDPNALPLRCTQLESDAQGLGPWSSESHITWSLLWLWDGDALLELDCNATPPLGSVEISLRDPLHVARVPLLPKAGGAQPTRISGQGLRGKVVQLQLSFSAAPPADFRVRQVTLRPASAAAPDNR